MNKDIEMPEHIARHKESGMSVWSYCRQNSIGYHRMQYWIKKLRRPDPRAATPAKEMFVELSLPQKQLSAAR